MAKRTTKPKPKPKAKKPAATKAPPVGLWRRMRRAFWRTVALAFLVVVAAVLLGRVINPPTTIYMMSESRRLGGVDHEWVPMREIAPVMARAAVAAGCNSGIAEPRACTPNRWLHTITPPN